MAQSGFTPIKLYLSTTAAAVPLAADLAPGELAINNNDGKLFYEDSSGVVQVIATKAGSSGDVVGPASATANAVPSFSGTTGKLIQNNSGVTIAAGVLTATGVSAAQVDITAQGDLRLQDTTGGEYVALQAPATIASSYTLTLPTDDGTAGQALITDGSGVLSWSTAASGDVYGPASATDNAVARFDLTTGKIIQNSVVTIADTTGNMAGVGTLSSGAITSSALTSGRVPFAGTAGLIQDAAALTFDGTILSATRFAGALNGTVGATSASTGAFTTLSASSTVSGTGFTNYFASPPAIGSTAPSTGAFTTLSASSQLNLTNASNYNLNATGAGANYMAGALGIGSTALTTDNLVVGRPITGGTSASGAVSNGQIQTSVTSLGQYFATVANQIVGATTGNVRHYAASQGTYSGTVTNQFGFFVDSTLTGATNNYGFYGNIASGTNRYNLYMNGTADNYMAGALGIGSTSLANNNLVVAKNITGASNSASIFSTGQIQTDVTGVAQYFSSTAAQIVGATTSVIRHFSAAQGIISGTATNQYGFFADATLTGAGSNFGFYGNIASGTNRYNLYMNGTADNYMAGKVGIGATVPYNNLQLLINGTVTSASTFAQAVLNTAASDTNTSAVFTGYYTQLSTSATALGVLDYYTANQGVLTGAVTTQRGFVVNSTLTGATTNIGFYSNIASGANRYNFYANGTAQNVFVGQTSIGGFAGAESLRVSPVVSAVNYLEVTGGATGSAVTSSAQGSDTNIDYAIAPKGTGNVQFGTLTASADAPITGYITIKDSGGTVRKLAIIA